jgi:hypothetical protein
MRHDLLEHVLHLDAFEVVIGESKPVAEGERFVAAADRTVEGDGVLRRGNLHGREDLIGLETDPCADLGDRRRPPQLVLQLLGRRVHLG